MNVSEGQVTHREARYFGSIQAYLYAIVQNLKRPALPTLLLAVLLAFVSCTERREQSINSTPAC